MRLLRQEVPMLAQLSDLLMGGFWNWEMLLTIAMGICAMFYLYPAMRRGIPLFTMLGTVGLIMGVAALAPKTLQSIIMLQMGALGVLAITVSLMVLFMRVARLAASAIIENFLGPGKSEEWSREPPIDPISGRPGFPVEIRHNGSPRT